MSFDVAKNLTVTIDVNCWLHGLCSKPQDALMMTCDPSCPPNDLMKTLDTCHESMKQRNATPYCVFDCHKHPMKSKTHEEYANTRAKAEESLQLFYEHGKCKSIELEEVDHVKSVKNIKNIAVPDDKITSLVVEWLKKKMLTTCAHHSRPNGNEVSWRKKELLTLSCQQTVTVQC